MSLTLVDLVEDVIEGHILPLLGWNDLLRFRRVCKTTHEITTKYMRIHPELAPEIGITEEEDRNFKAFMTMAIPTTKIFLDNEASGFNFYENERDYKNLALFLKEYRHLVKCLRVKELSLFVSGLERLFLEYLTNLESLEADYFGFGTGTELLIHNGLSDEGYEKLIEQDSKSKSGTPLPLPCILRSLDKLQVKVGQRRDQGMENVVMCTHAFLYGCPERLEYLALPFNSNVTKPLENVPREELCVPVQSLAISFHYCLGAILARVERLNQVNLKVIDFANYHDELDTEEGQQMIFAGSLFFLKLCLVCLQNNIKLLNVAPSWFANSKVHPEVPEELTGAELGKVVYSLVNINPFVFDLEMPNLERIEIKNASQSNGVLLPGQSRPVWSNLKCLDIHVDCKTWRVNYPSFVGSLGLHYTKNLFNFFFKGVQRLNLVELCLKFKENAGRLAVPNTEEIVSSCPNLKKLRIVNWPGTNKALIKLWSGLPGLEEVSLENCKQLGNGAFLGEDKENPVFLKLKKLKKLSLKQLDKMPKITNFLFSRVIRHLQLTHFNITSLAPVKSVTLAGVETLLTGPFKDSIEKFSFCDWSLENVSSAEFQATEKKFRSYNMI